MYTHYCQMNHSKFETHPRGRHPLLNTLWLLWYRIIFKIKKFVTFREKTILQINFAYLFCKTQKQTLVPGLMHTLLPFFSPAIVVEIGQTFVDNAKTLL